MSTLTEAAGDEISVEEWTPEDVDATARLAHRYRDVFGGDPRWNAGWWCRACSTPTHELRFNFDTPVDRCPRCGAALEERWPVEPVLEKSREQLGHPGSARLGLWAGDRAVGGIIVIVAAYGDVLDRVIVVGTLGD